MQYASQHPELWVAMTDTTKHKMPKQTGCVCPLMGNPDPEQRQAIRKAVGNTSLYVQ
jgi:hypothetical protein